MGKCQNCVITAYLTILLAAVPLLALELKNGAYEGLVVQISDKVPQENCGNIIENLQISLTSASQYLFSALDSRAFLRSATVLLPQSWPDSCVPSAVMSGAGEASDITVLPSDPARGRIFTQQSLGCGQKGDQIYLGYESLIAKDNTLGRTLIKEFAKYRFGVFEEQGYFNDPIYPMCFYDDSSKSAKVTGCSDLPIKDLGICTSPTTSMEYNTTKMVDENARSSIMFAPEAPNVSMFCDEGNHDRFAPTKHNLLCGRRSVLDVILSHSDFAAGNNVNMNSNQITDTTPRIVYKKQNLTRYIFIIENTKDMMQRESWYYLRLAMRQWALNTLPGNTEIGMVLAESSTTRALNITAVNSNPSNNYANARDNFYSFIPYTPSESMQPGCLHCALKEATAMISERNHFRGEANNVIVVIAPGMTPSDDLTHVLKNVKKSKIKIASINYPDIIRPETLRQLAEETNGADYTVFEQKLNVDTTLLSTYFELHNVLYNIVQRFYSGNEADLPVEIHRREITDDGRSSVTGSFMLDASMGEPAQFAFFTHNTVTPLIKGLKLISPSHKVYTRRQDKFIDFKMILLNANISETGTWTYTVEPYSGNPQPHFLQIMATPRGLKVPVVKTSFRVHRNSPDEPMLLLADVKYGDLPIMGAKVEVIVTKPKSNETMPSKFVVELLDSGSGDPDITKGDGIYTRYFSAAKWGPGLYTFEVTISDNGNTAYTWSESTRNSGKPCCGSNTLTSSVQPIAPFQRILPKTTVQISSEDIISSSQKSVGKVGDLKVEVIPEDNKARLSWTSPDMGGNSVSRYEIRYATSALDIVDKFETSAKIWEVGQPFPLSPGSETTFSLDFSQNKELLDKPLYFAIKAYPKMTSDLSGTISNYVRVYVPSPPAPPTVTPTYSSNDQSYWPNNNHPEDGQDNPSIAKAMNIGLELILPIAIGFILLVILLVLYCYFCVVKRRDRNGHKSTNKGMKNDKSLTSTITIVPSSPQHNPQQPSYGSDLADPHQIGLPVSNYAYEDETKKRYSLVNMQEQQLIAELKQQQMQQLQPQYNNGLSVISGPRTGHTLSPYNSWSASQLLHEHERRHSPMDNMMTQEEQMMLNGSQIDHMSLNGQSMDGMMYPGHLPPPVPPLPAYSNGYPANYSIYGVHSQPPAQHPQQSPPSQQQIYQSMQRNDNLAPFNASLQGSMSSVNSGDKKRRNVTMV